MRPVFTSSEQNPDDFLSLIIDGMNTVHFPFCMPVPKNSSRIEKLKLHVHGIIDHGNRRKVFFGSLDHWSHGSDYIATLLLHYIRTRVLIPSKPKYPHTLYLQADNCWKENKNLIIFSVLGMFILSG